MTAGEEAQPKPQFELVVAGDARLPVDGRRCAVEARLAHAITSPPAMTIAWPVMALALGKARYATALATSSGVTKRSIGLVLASSARAASALRPVLAMIVSTERATRSVSVKPGQTALRVTPRFAVSS